jgi:hypothetical protein
MSRVLVFLPPNNLLSNRTFLAVLLPSFLPKLRNLGSKMRKFAVEIGKVRNSAQKTATKSNFGEKLPNFFNLYIDFFTEMHKKR